MKKLALSVFSLGMLFAADSTTAKFTLSVTSPITVAGNKLKAGEYKVAVDGTDATFKLDGKSVKVPATIQKDAKQYKLTTIEAHDADVRAIHIGGTDQTVVFAAPIPVGGGTN